MSGGMVMLYWIAVYARYDYAFDIIAFEKVIEGLALGVFAVEIDIGEVF